MFVRKEPNSYYYVYWIAEGKRHRRSLKVKSRSSITPAMISAAMQANNVNYTLQELYRMFNIMHVKVHTYKTAKAHRNTFNHVKQHLSGDVTTAQINDYLARRMKQSVYQARKDLINIRAVYNWSIRMHYATANPCDGIKGIKLPERQPVYLAHDEYDRLMAAITDDDLKDIIDFLINTGLRLGELVSVSPHDINLEQRLLILPNHNGTTKSKRVRSIPLNDTAYQIALKRTQMASKRLFTLGQYQSADWISKSFKRAVRKARINPKICLHSLRHTFASWLVQDGERLDRVQALLGHSSITTTQIYAHLRADDLRSAVNRLNKNAPGR